MSSRISIRLSVRKIIFGLLIGSLAGCGEPKKTETKLLPPGKVAPELTGALTWLNSSELTLAGFRGKVVLLDFFEYSCVNCIRTFPYVKEWRRRYAPLGLEVIGVHTPQYGFTMEPANVYTALKKFELTFPVAVDSQFQIADAYENRFWPRVFLVDKNGHIRFDHTGEGNYQEIEKMIQALLRESNPSVSLPEIMAPLRAVDKPGAVCQPTTPELYLGTTRGHLANLVESNTNDVQRLRLPAERAEGQIYAEGDWSNQSEYLRHAADKEDLIDCLSLKYRAPEINVVMKPEGNYWMQVFVRQNGQWLPRAVAGEDVSFDDEGRSYVRVADPRMYNLVANQPYGLNEIRLYVRGKGLSVYSFSFGTCEVTPSGDKLRSEKE